MDSGLIDEYWLADFVGEGEDWVSKYLQSTHFVDVESDDIGERSTPTGNIANAEVSSILTSISSSTITHRRATTPKNSERIPFNKRWELLRPEIERLYIYKNVPLRGIVGIMKEAYGFDAA
jgi:Clr5 domain